MPKKAVSSTTTSLKTTTFDSDSDKREILKMELQESISTFRTQLSVLAQVIGILAVANVTIVGFALSSQNAATLLAGAMFPIVILGILRTATRWVRPVIYTAIVLERQIMPAEILLVSMWVADLVSPEYVKELVSISKEEDIDKRVEKLRKLRVPFLTRWGFTHISLLLIALVQLAIVPILVGVYGWKFV